MPEAAVTLTNPQTGVRFEVRTDSAGSYRVTNVPPGPGYQLDVTFQGFSPYEVKDLYVNVANSRTQNIKLTPGTRQEINVNADAQGVTINTTDASIGNNFEVSKLNDLPVQNRNSPSALFTLQPGITLSGATTGARTDQTNTTVDGLDVNDFGTGSFASIVASAPVDSVQEFRGITAGETADSGPGGGGQFQLVTRSGSNEWHGNINEYHRDNSTTANTWFNDEAGVTAPKLVQNQFGGSLGGPIRHNKLFFFFDDFNSRIAQQSSVRRTVPLASFAAGNVSYITNGPGCTSRSRQNTNAACIGTLTPAQVAAMDPAGIGESTDLFQLFKNRYPTANDLTSGDGVNTGGFRFNAPMPNNQTVYVGRLDWNATSRVRFYGRGTVTRANQVSAAAQFPGDPPATQRVDRSYAYLAGMNWQISDSKVNDLTYGNVVQDLNFPNPSNPQGVYQLSFATGVTTLLDDPYSGQGGLGRHIPVQQVNDNFTWTLGRHSLQMGGYFKWIHSTSRNIGDYNGLSVGLGGRVFGLNAQLRPSNVLATSSTAQVTYDSAFAAALGRIGSLSTHFNYDTAGNALPQPSGSIRDYRYYQTQPYISDSWKVTPALTLTFGLNYQYFTVPYEINGLETVQDLGFDQCFNARLAQSAAGVSGPQTVPFITYYLGGPKNHGRSLYNSNPYNYAPRVAFAYNPGFDKATVFNGSAGIVYDRTVINAVEGQQSNYSYLFQQNFTTNYGASADPSGSLRNDPRLNNRPTAVAPPTPKPPFQPYVVNGIPTGLQNGAAFNEMIDPNLKTPYSILANFGMQHQFPGAFILKVNWVGRFGRRLLSQADASQIIDYPDTASGQTLAGAVANVETALRNGADPKTLPAQPWFEHKMTPGVGAQNGYANNTQYAADNQQSLLLKGDFADFVQAISSQLDYNVGMGAQFSENTVFTNKGFSSYNGLLLTLQKNMTHGLQFDFNYTWSHSIDNVSLVANGVAFGGYGFICDAVHPRECRGNSDFDTTHYITSDFTYNLPFGRGRSYGSRLPWALDQLVGGWDLSGIPTWHSGQAFSTVSSAFVAGYANDAPALFNGDTHAIRRKVHKTADGSVTLFADPAAAVNAFSGPVGLQIGSRNNLRGPLFFNVDAGLAKNFDLNEARKVQLQFRADAFNIMNHPNFDTLSYATYSNYIDVTQPGNFGQLTANVTGVGAPRVLQLSGRIQF